LKPLPKKGRAVREKRRSNRGEMMLVEFRAPRELVEAFDSNLLPRFSNRSEAIRYLMWTFLEESERG
jgi:metal-responsive CopG/Arc/MetJ family transcriptional regulator